MPTLDAQFLAVSTGTNNKDLKNLKDILAEHPKIQFICIDVANGYLNILVRLSPK
jgi:GMP reductase